MKTIHHTLNQVHTTNTSENIPSKSWLKKNPRQERNKSFETFGDRYNSNSQKEFLFAFRFDKIENFLKDNLHFDRNQSGLRLDFKLAYRNEFLSYEHNFSFRWNLMTNLISQKVFYPLSQVFYPTFGDFKFWDSGQKFNFWYVWSIGQ